MTIPTVHIPNLINNQSLTNFSRYIQGNTDTHGAMHFSPEWGKGFVKSITDHKGIRINIWQISLRFPLILFRNFREKRMSGFISILYNLEPESLSLHQIDEHYQYFKSKDPSLIFLPQNVDLQFMAHPHIPVRVVEVHISTKHLQKYATGISHSLLENRFYEILARPCSAYTIVKLNQIAGFYKQQKIEMDQIIALNNEILENEFNQAHTYHTHDQNNTSGHIEKMLLIKNILEQHLKKDLPPLTQLATESGMTVSTMKRHFKQYFGLNIYQYYLERKMELAKKMLYEGELTVNETAEIFGYASVSNFIDMFKKYQGCSPGRIKSL